MSIARHCTIPTPGAYVRIETRGDSFAHGSCSAGYEERELPSLVFIQQCGQRFFLALFLLPLRGFVHVTLRSHFEGVNKGSAKAVGAKLPTT